MKEREIQPGEFGEVEDDTYSVAQTENGAAYAESTESEPSQDFIDDLRRLTAEFGIDPKVVYYPCSGYEGGPEKAFPDAKVIFLDSDPMVASRLEKKGFKHVVLDDALKYTPDQEPDLVVIQNPKVEPDFMAERVKTGGYVIANNYHKTAIRLSKLPGFKLIGALVGKEDGNSGQIIRQQFEPFLEDKGRFEIGIPGQFIFEKLKTQE